MSSCYSIHLLVFIIYDRWVERRQKVVMKTAVQTRAIVSSLFPSNVRDRLYESDERNQFVAKEGLKEETMTIIKDTKPVADTFADCTVCFIDIAGFTSWSSVREPTQVFILLETLYGAYDEIAERRGVFKVRLYTVPR